MKKRKTDIGEYKLVSIRRVEPNRESFRKRFDEDALDRLAESIKRNGIIEPLIVVDCVNYYLIVAGEMRWRAAKIAGLKKIPVIVKKYTETQIAEVSLAENLHRVNLNPIEEAKAYYALITKYDDADSLNDE